MAWCTQVRHRNRIGFLAISLFVVGALSPFAGAEEPLHKRIDRAIESSSFGMIGPRSGDSTYLRRLHLDLTGRIPTSTVARTFLDSDSPTKRVEELDRLLGSRAYARHMATVLDITLTERRAEKHVKRDEWLKYLMDSVAANKPWNQLAREILAADGTDEKIRSATAFYFYRDVEPNLLTRDIGRIFFGMDLQCCQCHDHPLIDTYYQADYYGLFAFVNRGTLVTDKDKKVFYAEKAEGDVAFTSVFTQEQGATRPRLPGGFELNEPLFAIGDEYNVKPADKVRPVPKYSRRSKLAELATNGSHAGFNRNIVNRLWAHMMGRGLVTPVDLHHVDNAAQHPELLSMMAEAFVAMKYDIKAFLRELALTETYQRSLQEESDLLAAATSAREKLASLQTDLETAQKQLAETRELADERQAELSKLEETSSGILKEHAVANKAVADAKKAADEAAKKLNEAKAALATKQEVAQALAEAAAKAKAAIEKLPEEKELVAAANTFEQRAKKLGDEAEAAEKTANDLTPPAESTAATLAEKRTSVDTIKTRLESANKVVTTFRPNVQEARDKLDQLQTITQFSELQVENAQRLDRVGELFAAWQNSNESLDKSTKQLASSRASLAESQTALTAMEAEMSEASSQHSEANRVLAEAQARLSAKEEAFTLIADATATAAVAAGKLPKDEELKKAAAKFQLRNDQLASELTELRTATTEQEAAAQAANERMVAAQQQLAATRNQITAMMAEIPKLEVALPELQSNAESSNVAFRLEHEELLDRWEKQFFSSPLAPLTPEQMAWSVMQASGVVQQHFAASEAEVNKNLPLDEKKPDEPVRLRERANAREQFVYDKLKGSVGTFVKLFGHASGQPQTDFFATVDQALYFANAGTLQSWLNPSGNNLTARLAKLADPQAIAEELYLSVLTRRPTEQETKDVQAYLADRKKDRAVALKEMSWALITSAEFRFRH